MHSRRSFRLTGLVVLALVVALPPAPASVGAGTPIGITIPVHHVRDHFENLDPASRYSLLQRARRVLHHGIAFRVVRGAGLTRVDNDGVRLRANGTAPTLTWIGHATFLVQIDGLNIVTDPHWGATAGPLNVIGLRRLVPPGVRLEDLPRIDAVVISHDHYDHLDLGTVRELWHRFHPRFFVPLGLKAWLADEGITDVVELDWGEQARLGSVTFVSVPAQHASGRRLGDQNLRLWCSWVIDGGSKRLFFAGDTGYHKGFGDIAREWGPFDVAALPIGGYSAFEHHHPNHLNPEEAVQAFDDLHAGLLVPMHWGTFELNREPVREPPERLMREAVRRGDEEHVAILSPGQTIPW